MSPQRRTTLLSLAPALPRLSRAPPLSLPCPTLLPMALLPPLLSPRRRAPSPPLPGGARRGEAGRRRGALAALGSARRTRRRSVRRGEAGRRRGARGGARRGEARQGNGEARSARPTRRRLRWIQGARYVSPSLSHPLSPLSPPSSLSLIGEVLRGAGMGTRRRIQAAASTPCDVDPHDSGSRVDAWIQAGRVDSLLPRRGSTRRRHGSMARRPQPAASALIRRWIRRGGDPGGGSSEVRWLQYWAGTGSSMGSRMGSPAGSYFFLFFKRLTAAVILTCPPR